MSKEQHEIKLDDIIDVLNRAKETEDLLTELYNAFGPYELHNILYDKMKTNPCISSNLVSRLDNYFNFDDSE